MAKAIDFIEFIRVNKLEDIEFAKGYDDNYCLSFEVVVDDKHTIDYEFSHKGKQETRIRLFTYFERDEDLDMETQEISTEVALKLRGLA